MWTILLLEIVAYPATTIRDEYFFENIWTETLTLNTDSISVGIFDIRKLEEEDIQNDAVVYVPESMLKTLSHISIINREIKNIGDFNDNRYACFIGKSGNRFESESVFIEIYNVGTTGFVAGAVSGAVSGAVGGTISGVSNAWLNDGDYFEAAKNGFLTGFVSGAITGGIGGGISAYRNKLNFWTGNKVEMGRTRFAFNNTEKGVKAYQSWVRQQAMRERDIKANSKWQTARESDKAAIENRIHISRDINPSKRDIMIDPNQIGPLKVTIEGTIPEGCSYNVYADGELVKTIGAGGYYNYAWSSTPAQELTLFNVDKITIEMIGTPIVPIGMDSFSGYPSTNTIIETRLPW